MKTITAVLGALLFAAQPTAAAECLHYPPGDVSIAGKLFRQTFPGPPYYESTDPAEGAETFWLVLLAKPACVTGSGLELEPSAPEVSSVQLVVSPEHYETHAHLVGKNVVATGELFGSISAHHHTPVLLHVRSLKSQ